MHRAPFPSEAMQHLSFLPPLLAVPHPLVQGEMRISHAIQIQCATPVASPLVQALRVWLAGGNGWIQIGYVFGPARFPVLVDLSCFVD